MITSFNLVPVLISSLVFVAVSLLVLHLKFLRRELSALRVEMTELRKDRRTDLAEMSELFRTLTGHVTNHYTLLNRAIGRIEGKLGIGNDKK